MFQSGSNAWKKAVVASWVALKRTCDPAAFTMLTMRDRIDDARRGVENARNGLLPGTCNLVHLDERCELNVLRAPLAATPGAALSTSFGFGGMNAALVFRAA